MKKLVSPQGLIDGKYEDPNLSEAIHERVDNKLTVSYRHDFGEDIQVTPQLSYELVNGQVTLIELSYTIANPTPERLEKFCFECAIFYLLSGFEVVSEETPRVRIRVTDLYDMAGLIYALDYQSVSLYDIMCPVGFNEDSLPKYPEVMEWDTHDDGSLDEVDDEDDDPFVVDDKGVAYSEDGKVLKFCRCTFNEPYYEVPDGVEEIEDFAFYSCRHYIKLSMPRSVRTIGGSLFANGGYIVIR